jgi:hypothetical protein
MGSIRHILGSKVIHTRQERDHLSNKNSVIMHGCARAKRSIRVWYLIGK